MVLVAQLGTKDRVFGRDARLITGALHQHHAAGDVARGEDVRRRCLHFIVHRNVSALDLNAGRLEIHAFHVADPSDRKKYRLGD